MPVLHDQRVLAFNADCIACCPNEGYHDILAAGTYQLSKSTGIRTGRLYLYSLRSDEGRNKALHDLSTLDLPGIFELKWDPNPSAVAPWLALALTDGTVSLVQVGEDNEAVRKGSVDVDRAALSTCVAFQPPTATPDTVLSVSTSNGFLATIKVVGSRAMVLEKWLAHDLEIWACAFDCWKENLLFSGADDAILKAWDIRAPTTAPVFHNRKEHGAGVCCIQPSKQHEYVLCTGCYDEYIRLWDMRNSSRPIITAKAGTGGGVWRVNWHPWDSSLLLAACMDNGCAVFRSDAAAGSLEEVATYEGHRSIAYGADWFSGIDAEDQPIVASCSFYDNLVQVWSCELPQCSARAEPGSEADA